MKNEPEIMQNGGRITKKAHAGHGQESKWEIPVKMAASDVAAFTLTEFLALIAIIAIWAAIWMPGLAAARARALQVQCINNTKVMQWAWKLYAGENNDYMVPNSPYNSPANDSWCPNGGTPGASMNWTTDVGNTNVAVFSNTLLVPFLNGKITVYRCPADVWPSQNGYRVRDYSMQGQVGNLYCLTTTENLNPHGVAYIKLTDLHSAPGPANTIVFLEEHPNSLLNIICDGYLEIDSSGGTFPDVPGSNHGWGCGMSFADGHSEMHQWTTTALRKWVVPDGEALQNVEAGTLNADWSWFTTHCSSEIQ